jgi:hypothetical protein
MVTPSPSQGPSSYTPTYGGYGGGSGYGSQDEEE